MKVVLVRGLPNTGKSTYAKSLGCLHLEADMFHTRNGYYNFKQENVKAAHEWCLTWFQDAVDAGIDVVVSNTFTTDKEIRPYLDYVTDDEECELEIMRMEGKRGDNCHNVPDEVIDKMKQRFINIKDEVILYA